MHIEVLRGEGTYESLSTKDPLAEVNMLIGLSSDLLDDC